MVINILKRVFRVSVAVGIPVAGQYIAGSTNPWFLLAAPVLSGVGKWLREKYAVSYIPV